jgi:hypothetical protein
MGKRREPGKEYARPTRGSGHLAGNSPRKALADGKTAGKKGGIEEKAKRKPAHGRK